MKEQIKNKLDNYINSILKKGTLTKDEYEVLSSALSKIELEEKQEEIESESKKRTDDLLRLTMEILNK